MVVRLGLWFGMSGFLRFDLVRLDLDFDADAAAGSAGGGLCAMLFFGGIDSVF